MALGTEPKDAPDLGDRRAPAKEATFGNNSGSAVLDVAVLGVPNEEWGEELKAVVQLKPGVQARPEDISDFCAERLADYKRPRSVDFVDEVPRNPSGKLLKRELRKRYWGEAGRRI